jgi:hypothetical protein
MPDVKYLDHIVSNSVEELVGIASDEQDADLGYVHRQADLGLLRNHFGRSLETLKHVTGTRLRARA